MHIEYLYTSLSSISLQWEGRHYWYTWRHLALSFNACAGSAHRP